MDVTSCAATAEEVVGAGRRKIVHQENSQLRDNRDGAGGQFAFGAILANDQLVADYSFTDVHILGFEGAGFVDPATCVGVKPAKLSPTAR